MEYNYKDDIIATRKGGLGASDGNVLSKVDNLGHVPSSCMERLAIVKGIYDKESDITTEAMNIGNQVEMQIFDMLHNTDKRWESNTYVESKTFSKSNCKLFAHIDFYLKDDENKVLTFVECKATRHSIQDARHDYANQLYIEYSLGKEMISSLGKGWKFSLKLCHYNTDNYDGVLDVDKIEMSKIRFGRPLFNIHNAMDIISKELETLTEYYKEEIDANYLPAKVKNEVDTIASYLTSIKEMNEKVDEFKKRMYDFMVHKNIKSINNEQFLITRVDECIVPKFDSKKFSEEHRTTYKKYVKNTVRKGFALFKVKGDNKNNK